MKVRRRFINVHGRGVHYLRAGVGPPVVLLHAAMASAQSVRPLLEQLVADHTVFAFDHPGYGDSDPLPKRHVRISDAADALEATLVALNIPRCPVYGTHTGGAVALELARRHPARVCAVIVDGPTVFRPQEAKFFVSGEYLPPFKVEDDGSHLISSWVKTRDTAIWFPWSRRGAANRRPLPFPSVENLHESHVERLRAGDGYRGVYRAAFEFDARAAINALNTPITFMACADDLLFTHLERLPRLKRNQCVRRYPSDSKAYLRETARVVRGHRVTAQAPADEGFRPTAGTINRRYVDLPIGQILVRSAGEVRGGRPLLLIHDGRASSRVFEPLMRAVARRRAVYAPDLPDTGASDALNVRKPEIRHYADAISSTVAALRLGPCDLLAVGAGAGVAIELGARSAFAEARVLLEAPDFYLRPLAARLLREWVPALSPQWDGSHLTRLWLMLRDEYAFWPWFDKSTAAACAVDAPDNWGEIHARVTDILRSLPTYHRLTAAALRYEWAEPLRRVSKKRVKLTVMQSDPRRPYTEAAARLAGFTDVAVLSTGTEGKAREIVRLLHGTKNA
jgi:pimeloyl-ACP methyl ester carboxylesterase